MRNRRLTLFLVILSAFAPISHAHATTGDCEAKAGVMFDAMGRNDYAGASREMATKLQAPAQQKMMISIWETLIRNNWGPYRSHGVAEPVADDHAGTTLRLPLQFEHGTTTATITCSRKEGGAIDEIVLL